jgi:hypothetical protein
LSDKPVAAPGNGLDILRFFRRVAEGSAQGPNRYIDGVVKIDRRVIGPEIFPDLFARRYFAVSLNEQSQDLEWLFLKNNRAHPIPCLDRPQLAAPQVKLKGSEPHAAWLRKIHAASGLAAA